MKKKDNITRSLIVDKATWNDSMKIAKAHYNLSLSAVANNLLSDWLAKEKRKIVNTPLHPDQQVLIG